MANAKKVVFVVANEGYQPIEYAVPKKLLEQAGISVLTASDNLAPAIAKDGSTTSVDFTIENIPLDTIDGLFIVGGPGAMDHLDTAAMHRIIQKAIELEKKVGAICVSTRILAHAGILEDRQATGWNEDNELPRIYKKHGVHYKIQDVVRDENIVTATGPDAAREYGEQIISMIQE